MFRFLVFVTIVCISSTFASLNYTNVDTHRYSYICTNYNQLLCLGISPGPGLPYYNPASIYWLQIKQRARIQNAGEDFKKTRWDVRFNESLISLSRFPDLCIALNGQDYTQTEVGLFPCTDVKNGSRLGLWNTTFNKNMNEEGEVVLLGAPGQELCLSVMNCENNNGPWCNLYSTQVALNTMRAGAYVRLAPCWYSDPMYAEYKSAQVFVQAIDCAVGCSPMLQNNNFCDAPCNNAACYWDNGRCATPSPTPPTLRPTSITLAPVLLGVLPHLLHSYFY